MAKYTIGKTQYGCRKCKHICTKDEMVVHLTHKGVLLQSGVLLALLKCPECNEPLQQQMQDGKIYSIPWNSEIVNG